MTDSLDMMSNHATIVITIMSEKKVPISRETNGTKDPTSERFTRVNRNAEMAEMETMTPLQDPFQMPIAPLGFLIDSTTSKERSFISS